jgi:hypothetical protein
LEPFVTDEDQHLDHKTKAKGHWVLWTLVALFVVFSIGEMFTVDYYSAGDSEVSTHAPGAADN